MLEKKQQNKQIGTKNKHEKIVKICDGSFFRFCLFVCLVLELTSSTLIEPREETSSPGSQNIFYVLITPTDLPLSMYLSLP